MNYEMGGLAYAGHDMNGLAYGTIEMGAPVHRAVNTPGLHGLVYGDIEMGNLVYGADNAQVGVVDSVKAMFNSALAWMSDNKVATGVLLLIGVSLLGASSVPLFANKGKKRKGKKRKQTAKQRAASLRNLKKGRKSRARKRGAALTSARRGKKAGKRSGKRRVSAYSKAWGRFRKMGYSASEAARMAKGGKARGGKRKGRKSRSRSRR